jgi:hypothetical protein
LKIDRLNEMSALSKGAITHYLNGMLLLLVGGCSFAATLYPVERHTVETQAGPISVEVHGLAGGLTNNDLTRLVNAGIKQGCPGPVPPGVLAAAGPSLSMIWNVEPAGTPHPSVMVTARLDSDDHPVSSTFDRTISPDTAPYAVFEYSIAGVTCSLFRKAGYLSAAK